MRAEEAIREMRDCMGYAPSEIMHGWANVIEAELKEHVTRHDKVIEGYNRCCEENERLEAELKAPRFSAEEREALHVAKVATENIGECGVHRALTEDNLQRYNQIAATIRKMLEDAS